MMKEMTVTELNRRLSAGDAFQLVDVREADEWAIGHLPGAVHLPLSEFAQRGPEALDPDREVVLYCHHGMRSAQAQAYLVSKGFADVVNLTGGIDQWSLNVDPSLPRY